MAPLSRSGAVEGRAHRRTGPRTLVPGAADAPPSTAAVGGLAIPCRHAPDPSPRPPRCSPPRSSLAALRGRAGRRRSIRPGRARRTAAPRAPTRTSRRWSRRRFHGAAPETLDSGRNCTAANLGALAARGHLRGALRRRDLDVRCRAGGGARGLPRRRASTPTALAAFYADERQGQRRGRTITRPVDADDRRAARATGSTPRPATRLQTVVVWPAAEPTTSSTWSSPTTCPTRGSRTPSTRSVAADAALPASATGLVRVVGGRLVPALMRLGPRGPRQPGAADPGRRSRPATRRDGGPRGAGRRCRPSPAAPRRPSPSRRGRPTLIRRPRTPC